MYSLVGAADLQLGFGADVSIDQTHHMLLFLGADVLEEGGTVGSLPPWPPGAWGDPHLSRAILQPCSTWDRHRVSLHPALSECTVCDSSPPPVPACTIASCLLRAPWGCCLQSLCSHILLSKQFTYCTLWHFPSVLGLSGGSDKPGFLCSPTTWVAPLEHSLSQLFLGQ